MYGDLVSRPLTLEDSEKVAAFAQTMQRCYFYSLQKPLESRANSDMQNRDSAKSDAAGLIADPACDDLPEDAATRSDEFVAHLASLGDERAKFLMAGPGYLWPMKMQNIFRDPGRFSEYKKSATSALNELLDAGNYESMIVLSSIAQNPAWDEPNPATAWALQFAAARSRQDQRLMSEFTNELQTRVPAQDQARALSEAEAIFKRCCLSR